MTASADPAALRRAAETCRADGRLDEAVALLAQAVPLQPDDPALFVAFGDLLLDMGQPVEAAAAFEKSLRLDEAQAQAHRGLALALQSQGFMDRALRALETALDLDPSLTELHANQGDILVRQGRGPEAIAAYAKVDPTSPHFAAAAANAGHLSRMQDDAAAARDWYRRALNADPEDSAGAAAGLALLGDDTGAGPLSQGYVTRLFDEYADRFEEDLVGTLDYVAPQTLFDMVAPHLPARATIADLGCGTGLCGALFRPRAARLEGVDLSERMVAQAKSRGIYDALAVGDVMAWLAAEDRQFDLVVAGELLVYLGALEPVCDAVAPRVAPGGLFALTLERNSEPGTRLGPNMRYLHDRAAVENAAEHAGVGNPGVG